MVAEAEAKMLATQIAVGTPRNRIIASWETEHIPRPQNWNSWTSTYNAVYYDPPLVFDLMDAVSNDTSTVVNTWRLAMSRFYHHDTSNLFAICDETMTKIWRGWGYSMTNLNGGSHMGATNCTKVTLLMKASKSFYDSIQYTTFYSRREHAIDPTNNVIYYEYWAFKPTTNGYVVTGDVDDSQMFSPDYYAGVRTEISGRMYTNAYLVLQQTSLPPHFYTIP
jgi:hypothetical protein